MLLLLFLIALLHAWMRTVRDPSYFAGDILTQFLPYYGMLGERLAALDLPGWNPTLFSGMPLAGDPISGWGYLPVMGLFPFFSPEHAYRLHVALHYAGAGGAAYLLGRVLGMSRLGAFAAGSAFLLGPMYAFAQCCTARMQVSPWIPLAMMGYELAIRARAPAERVAWWGLTGLAFAQMIAGYFGKGFYYGILLCGAFLAYRVVIDPPAERPPLRVRAIWLAVHAGATLALGLLLSAITLLPRLDFLAVSNLQGGSYEAVGEGAARSPAWPLERALASLLNPNSTTYAVGVATLALAIGAVALAERRFAAPFWAISGVAIVILTLETTPLHQLFYLIPRFRSIHEHQPQRILVMFNLAPAMLAGGGVTLIQRSIPRPRAYALAAGAIAAAFVFFAVATRGSSLSFSWSMAAVAGLVVLAFGVLAARRLLPRRIGPATLGQVVAVAVMLLLVADLDRGRVWDAVSQGLATPSMNDIARTYLDGEDLGGAGEFLRGKMATEGPFRFFGYDADYLEMPPDGGGGRNYRLQWRNPLAAALLVNNRALTLGLHDIQGYNPVHFMDYRQWFIAGNGRAQEYHETNVLLTGLFSPLFDLLGARYILVPAAVPPGRPDLLHLSARYPTVFANDTVRVLENPAAAPPVWIAGDSRVVTFEEATSLLARRAVDPFSTVLLQSEPRDPAGADGPGSAGSAVITGYEPDHVTVAAELTRPGFLVLNEPYDAGWVVTVDGAEGEVLQANGVMRAVPLTSGTHTVTFAFQPASLTLGLWLTIGTALAWLVAVLGLALLWPRVRPRATSRWRRLAGGRPTPSAWVASVWARLRMPEPNRTQDAVALVVLTLAIAVKSWERLHFNQWTGRVDVLGQYLPWWSYLGQGLRDFDIPGWNPHQFAGTPFLGDPQSGWMYLPVMLLFTFLPPIAAMKAYVVVHLVIGGFSLYALARVVGLRPIGAFAAAVAFVFGPFIHHTTYCCNIQAHLAAWLPAALIGLELGLRARTWGHRLAWFALTGVAIAQFNAGWIGQGTYNGMLVIGGYLIYRCLIAPPVAEVAWRRRALTLLTNGVIVLVLGLGLSAAAVLPRLEVNAETNLAGGNYENVEDVSGKEGASVATMLNRLINSDDDTVRRTYIGAATLALALLALFFTRRPPLPFFAALAVIPIVLTMRTTPIHWLFYLLPRFQEIHEHDRIRVLSVYMVGSSILAGATVDAVARGVRLSRLLFGGLLVTPVVWTWRWGLPGRLRGLFALEHPLLKALLAVSAVLIATALLSRFRPGVRPWLNGTAALALVGLLLWEPAGRELVNTLITSPVESDTPRAIAVATSEHDPGGAGEFLQRRLAEGEEPFRFFGYLGGNLRTADGSGFAYQSRRKNPLFQPLLLTARAMRLGLYDIQGYNPVQLQRVVDLFLAINGEPLNYHDEDVLPAGWDSPWLDVLGVRYAVLSNRTTAIPELLHFQQTVAARYPTVFANEWVRVVERPGVYPHAWIVHEAVVYPRDAAYGLIETRAVDPRQVAILEPGAEAPMLAPAGDRAAEGAEVTSYERDRIELTATATAPGILVLSEIDANGWHATVDGRSVDLLAVDGALRGVPLPAGEHTVVLTYAPRSIPLGMVMSALTLLAIVLAAVALRRRVIGGRPPGGDQSPSSAGLSSAPLAPPA